jgi:predicted RNA-binding Zn-ribbon protein involved in translation (DUF1610 family)
MSVPFKSLHIPRKAIITMPSAQCPACGKRVTYSTKDESFHCAECDATLGIWKLEGSGLYLKEDPPGSRTVFTTIGTSWAQSNQDNLQTPLNLPETEHESGRGMSVGTDKKPSDADTGFGLITILLLAAAVVFAMALLFPE